MTAQSVQPGSASIIHQQPGSPSKTAIRLPPKEEKLDKQLLPPQRDMSGGKKDYIHNYGQLDPVPQVCIHRQIVRIINQMDIRYIDSNDRQIYTREINENLKIDSQIARQPDI